MFRIVFSLTPFTQANTGAACILADAALTIAHRLRKLLFQQTLQAVQSALKRTASPGEANYIQLMRRLQQRVFWQVGVMHKVQNMPPSPAVAAAYPGLAKSTPTEVVETAPGIQASSKHI
jgi:hypothetical protein